MGTTSERVGSRVGDRTVETTRGRFVVLDTDAPREGPSRAPVLVLLHAFPLSAVQWREDAAALSTSMRVVCPSMRGFGGSDPFQATPSVDTMADDVVAILDALAITEPVVLGGLSMGGYVAFSVARRAPERVRAFVFADTKAEPDSDEAKANREKVIRDVQNGNLRAFVEGMIDKGLSPRAREANPALAEEARSLMLASDGDAVIHATMALRDRPDSRPTLPAIRVPSLVVVGADDGITPPAVAKELASALPDGRLVEIPAAGHFANLDAPSAFRAALSSFVADVTKPS